MMGAIVLYVREHDYLSTLQSMRTIGAVRHHEQAPSLVGFSMMAIATTARAEQVVVPLASFERQAIIEWCQLGHPAIAILHIQSEREVPYSRSIMCVPKSGDFGLHIFCSHAVGACILRVTTVSKEDTLTLIQRVLGIERDLEPNSV